MSSSRSSSDAREGLLTVGRVAGHRGTTGEFTIRVAGGDAATWDGAAALWLTEPGGAPRRMEIESSRAYRDRWVVKVLGIDDATTAGNLKGSTVAVAEADAPDLDAGEHWVERLLGARVETEPDGEVVGTVVGVTPTGGKDVLVIRRADGGEVLVPFADGIVTEVDEAQGRIRIDPPDGLLDLND